MKRTFVFGDLHGCYDELMSLMHVLEREAHLDPNKDVVGFLGDHIDRGPDSMKVIDQLMKWNKKYPHWFFLYGNHEDLMLDALVYKGKIYGSYDLWWQQGGKETAHSYFPSEMSKYDMAISQPMDHIKTKHLNWLKNLPLYHEDERYFYVHGGVVPMTSLEEQVNFLQKGTPDEQETIRKAFLWARDLFIDSDTDWGKKIIFGHTADYSGRYHPQKKRFQPIVMHNKIGIDTAVCPPSSNGLTCVELPTEKFYYQMSFERIKRLQNI